MSTEALLHDMRGQLRDGGLHGCLLVRDLHTGDELGIDPDTQLPAASLVKVPLALATVERVRRGELDGATVLDVEPGRITTPGPTGLSRFRHPARIALDDLLYLSTCVSDGTAADALFELTPPAQVARILQELGLRGLTVRHGMRELTETPVERFDAAQAHLAHALAIDSGTSGRGHRVPQLDTTRANTGSARAYAELLQALWTPSAIHPDVAGRVRELMANNLLRHRLTPDFSSDATTWSSKTGTLLNLRHEIGVVEHSDGQAFAVAVLTESLVPAGIQPGAEALMSQVARTLRDHLRQL
ncbi:MULTISPECIES: serine hydrolase [unclassified Streptomyces]|uniref:serine hydrolase n=1 Tax=unclassified Streptomyces TaxID=2593676 RepID=UPI002DDB3781|nr:MULTISPECIES: serine hydrolase [unclassified Streptomyces]WSA92236.1 class A beta-lactamase-related serine hydrolase [Streptomyces sp. NBC_01795]WSB76602.1 class A beta-lactamase-related serine hydrolase [Streptomyces sp. NBC_01775]WSS15111.1 class A beta-lactamase-related serine hydrolase [Streptomyces sp. NBC_01186]WSS43954.1 class A beta-lactamase-related serine hydrolase [Streptomyces sp. NBC_01187]